LHKAQIWENKLAVSMYFYKKHLCILNRHGSQSHC